MMDSSVKSLGKVEYDNQNCIKHKEKPVRRKIRSEVYVLMLLYMNWSITKYFPIETLLKMIDSSVRSPGDVESLTFTSVLIRNFFVMDRFMYSGNSR